MTLLSNDILIAYNQLLANITKPSLGNYLPCVQCGASFSDAKSLAKHELSHNQSKRKHECKECGKKFNSSSDLKRHSLIHTNTRPYKCHLCPTAFVQQAHLTRHLKSHTRHGVRFKCLGCGTMFLHSTNVRWHQQFCDQAQGSNGGYVVTQSEGEGLDTVSPNPKRIKRSPEPVKLTGAGWARENKIYYFDGPFSMNGASRHSSSSDTDTSSPSTDGSETVSTQSTATSFNSSKLVYFDGPYDKTELLNRKKAKIEPVMKPLSSHLSPSQLSYLNSRVSMVAPRPLQNLPCPQIRPTSASDLPTDELLKLLSVLQEGQNKVIIPTNTAQNVPGIANVPASHSDGFPIIDQIPRCSQVITAPSPTRSPTYKIVPNKIIQHNVSPSQAASQNNEDRIKPILELVKKLVAEGLQSPTAEVILNAISRHLGNVTATTMIPPFYLPYPPNKKRKLAEPAQKRYTDNLLTSQDLLNRNLGPLLNTSSVRQPLSFTPLMFRQMPHIATAAAPLPQAVLNHLPASMNTFSPNSAPSFASQLLQLTNMKSPSTDCEPANSTLEARKPSDVTEGEPIETQDTESRVKVEPVSEEEEVTRAKDAPIKQEPAVVTETNPGLDQLDANVELAKNIAFHRLNDLLSFV